MPLPTNIRDKEDGKFVEDTDGNVGVRVGNSVGSPLNIKTKELIQGEDYNLVSVTYPTGDSEVFTYTKNGSTVLIVTVTYQTAAKRNLDNVAYTI